MKSQSKQIEHNLIQAFKVILKEQCYGSQSQSAKALACTVDRVGDIGM